jgi:hypothetical protein
MSRRGHITVSKRTTFDADLTRLDRVGTQFHRQSKYRGTKAHRGQPDGDIRVAATPIASPRPPTGRADA